MNNQKRQAEMQKQSKALDAFLEPFLENGTVMRSESLCGGYFAMSCFGEVFFNLYEGWIAIQFTQTRWANHVANGDFLLGHPYNPNSGKWNIMRCEQEDMLKELKHRLHLIGVIKWEDVSEDKQS